MWYYDALDNNCKSFVYGGCEGNGNRFDKRGECEGHCVKKTVKVVTEPPRTYVVPQPDRTSNEDVCLLPQEHGPCLGYYRKWYYDALDNNCKSFVYGGCEGNGNRFDKRVECESHCVKTTARTGQDIAEPPRSFAVPQPDRTSNEGACLLPVEPGPCKQAQPRWFYDAQTQSCLPFVFGGCGGNTNRFKTSEICLKFCTGIKATSVQERPRQPPSSPEPRVLKTTIPSTPQCASSNCADIQCPYGIEKSFDINGCSSCRCSNPCEVHSCPDDSRCAIDVVINSQNAIRTEPVCRRMVKPGSCPPTVSVGSIPSDCESRCRDDADCRGEQKCCDNGCAFQCVPPAAAPEDTSCVDNPQYSNCKQIVQAGYCRNKFYGKFCCASCMKAGQLQSLPQE